MKPYINYTIILLIIALQFGVHNICQAEEEIRIDWNDWWNLSEAEIIERKGEPDGKTLLYKEKYASVSSLMEFRFQKDKLIAIKITPLVKASVDELYSMYRQFAGQFTEHFGTPDQVYKQDQFEEMMWVIHQTKLTLTFNNSRWKLLFQYFNEEK